VHALTPQTSQPVWKYEMSKRGINTGAVLKDNWAIVSHSEENFDSVEMGLLAAIDATAKGRLEKIKSNGQSKDFKAAIPLLSLTGIESIRSTTAPISTHLISPQENSYGSRILAQSKNRLRSSRTENSMSEPKMGNFLFLSQGKKGVKS